MQILTNQATSTTQSHTMATYLTTRRPMVDVQTISPIAPINQRRCLIASNFTPINGEYHYSERLSINDEYHYSERLSEHIFTDMPPWAQHQPSRHLSQAQEQWTTAFSFNKSKNTTLNLIARCAILRISLIRLEGPENVK